jgi:cyclin-dependent kinase regulatory subunit CKS1
LAPCSERYYDDIYEYRHVVLPQEMVKKLPKNRLMSEVRFQL